MVIYYISNELAPNETRETVELPSSYGDSSDQDFPPIFVFCRGAHHFDDLPWHCPLDDPVKQGRVQRMTRDVNTGTPKEKAAAAADDSSTCTYRWTNLKTPPDRHLKTHTLLHISYIVLLN